MLKDKSDCQTQLLPDKVRPICVGTENPLLYLSDSATYIDFETFDMLVLIFMLVLQDKWPALTA